MSQPRYSCFRKNNVENIPYNNIFSHFKNSIYILTILGENVFSYFKKDVILSNNIVLVLSKTDSYQEKFS